MDLDTGVAYTLVRLDDYLRTPTPSADFKRRLVCMRSTSVPIDVATHDELERLAAELHTSVHNTATRAVRALRHNLAGSEPPSISSSGHPSDMKRASVTLQSW